MEVSLCSHVGLWSNSKMTHQEEEEEEEEENVEPITYGFAVGVKRVLVRKCG